MALSYFHSTSGHTTLDAVGTDLPNLPAIRAEAIRALRELLFIRSTDGPWRSDPWRVWVTDQPNANGHTILTLEVASR